MNKDYIKIISAITLIIGVFIWLLFFLAQGFNPVSFDSVKSLFTGFTTVGLFWGLYFSYAWRWPCFKKILYIPDVNGTWIGYLESSWRNEQKEKLPPMKFVLVIRQTWLTISVKAFTDSQKTNSHIEKFIFDNSQGTKILAYLYAEVDNSPEGDSRKGAAELDLVESKDIKILEGKYWTYKTHGTVSVNRISSKEKVESFQFAKKNWPNENDWVKIENKNEN